MTENPKSRHDISFTRYMIWCIPLISVPCLIAYGIGLWLGASH